MKLQPPPSDQQLLCNDVAGYWLQVDPSEPSLLIGPAGDDRPVLRLPSALLLTPEFTDADLRPGRVSVSQVPLPTHATLRLHAPLQRDSQVEGWIENTIHLLDHRLICEARYRLEGDHAVRHWHIAPQGSQLDVEHLHAMMGRPKQETNGREFPAGDAEISTAGHNYFYAITGPRLAARRGNVALCLGGAALANDFGLECRTVGGVIEHLRFNYGGEVPLELGGQQTHHGPRLQVLFAPAEPYHENIHGRFIAAMAADGIIQPYRFAPEDAVWRRPVYCTWGDQVLSGKTMAAGLNWRMQKASNHILDEGFVRRTVDEILKHRLNVGTIIIDAGWQDKRGDWNLNTTKFPNLRRLVDDLHEQGFKVMMWWAPLQVEAGAAVLQRQDMVAGPNRHGDMFLNYQSPATREHVTRILHRFFNSGRDGWNLDGLKLDWMIEKIYPQPGPSDLAWRGEERCLHSIYRMVHSIARMHKPCVAITGGVSENPHVAPYIAWRSLEERFDSANLDYLEQHARLMEALRPGVPIKNHLNYDAAYAVEAVRRVKALGGVPEIGVVLPENTRPEIMARLREALA